MSSKERQHDAWEACPAGELSRMVQRVDATQRRARRKQVYGIALASTALFACVVLALGSLMGTNNSLYGGIKCSYCRNHFAEYQPHVAGELVHEDAAFVARMKIHLEKCSFCRDRFNATYPDQRIAHATTTGSWGVGSWEVGPWGVFAMQPRFATK